MTYLEKEHAIHQSTFRRLEQEMHAENARHEDRTKTMLEECNPGYQRPKNRQCTNLHATTSVLFVQHGQQWSLSDPQSGHAQPVK